MAANNKTQMVLSDDNSITVSKCRQSPVMSAHHPPMKFFYPNIAQFCTTSPKHRVLLLF